jgi:hypothetical protein
VDEEHRSRIKLALILGEHRREENEQSECDVSSPAPIKPKCFSNNIVLNIRA